MEYPATDAGQLAKAYFAVWNQRDYARIRDVVTDSFVMYDPLARAGHGTGPSGEVHGPDGLRAFIRLIVTAFPDFHVELIDVSQHDERVLYEGVITMTHAGTFYGIPPTHRSAEFRYMGVLDTESDGVSVHRVYHDLRHVVTELTNALPAVLRQTPAMLWGWVNREVRR